MRAMHIVTEFHGQSAPEQPQSYVKAQDIDMPILTALMVRWVARYSSSEPEWRDVALFRSLNMANEAAKIPASTATGIYDVGRALALWVSALEILAHPGAGGTSNLHTVFQLLDKVVWLSPKMAEKLHPITYKKKTETVGLASNMYYRIFGLRNAFLHGNPVDPVAFTVQFGDYAACLYRLALTGFLGLDFKRQMPRADEPDEIARFIGERLEFRAYQDRFERALLVA